ncbi:alpha/beta-hydrolase [Morchella conica CCBAS932]|uniref:Alpha/beta-hydrolase n=1 Tax=Morchella conica CCBAS932 TaxID=1392247 RepID=A0A3N4KPD3_9PEZI|nr:alpha/beta-hydrolase [Morchella conica CCBAS932]
MFRESPLGERMSYRLCDCELLLSRIVDIAYCVGSLNTGVSKPFQCLSFCKDFPTFTLQQTWNTGITLSDSCGYIALSHPPAPPRIIVAFRGTYSIANALADLAINKQEYVPYPDDGHTADPAAAKCNDCLVHAGFLQSWSNTNALISDVVAALRSEYPGYRLTLVGHSLGGAVAALAALDYKGRGWDPHVTTFGEPKVGNQGLADYFDARFGAETYRRVTHAEDPVPLVPLGAWGYRQHAGEYFVERVALPVDRCDVRLCVGQEDPECVAGGRVNAVQMLWAHRDYFHRLGLCVPPDSLLRKIRYIHDGLFAELELELVFYVNYN